MSKVVRACHVAGTGKARGQRSKRELSRARGNVASVGTVKEAAKAAGHCGRDALGASSFTTEMGGKGIRGKLETARDNSGSSPKLA